MMRRLCWAIVFEFLIPLAMCEPMRDSALSKEVLSVKMTWR